MLLCWLASTLIFNRFNFLHARSTAEKESLYSPNDPIIQTFGTANFEENVFFKNYSLFVDFYASWCGHCISFAPTFKKFAQSVIGWQKVTKIVAVNCVANQNADICREQKITRYPTLKYFRYWSSYGEEVPNGDETIDYLRSQLADKIRTDYEVNKPTEWPVLNYIDQSTSLDDLWDRVRSPTTKHIVLFVDKTNTTTTGAELILEFVDHVDELSIFTSLPDSRLAAAHGFSSPGMLPGVLIFAKNFNVPVFQSREAHSSLDIVRQRILFHTKIKLKNVPSDSWLQLTTSKSVSKSQSNLFAHKLDLLSALRHIFYDEVRKFEHVRGTKLDVLKNFMELLVEYFNGNDDEQKFLVQLTSWLNSIRSQMSSTMWVSRLNQLQQQNNAPLPAKDVWRGCRGSSHKYRGFPCSLWMLFHTITVHAYQKNGKSAHFWPDEVMTTIKLFVREFFGCDYCAKHFQNETANLESDVTTPRDLVLYLWRVHNQVNQRLKGKASEDPLFVKEQFPSSSQCPSCFNSRRGQWNEQQVLLFLIKFYVTHLRHDESAADDGAKWAAPDFEDVGLLGQSSSSSSSRFSYVDFTLCFVLWWSAVLCNI